jgi:hypothetical protein
MGTRAGILLRHAALEMQLRPLSSEIWSKEDHRKRDPQVTAIPLWIANHADFSDKALAQFRKLDVEYTNGHRIERPWSSLDNLKKTFKEAAKEIEKENKDEKPQAEDALPILIALARLMDKDVPDHANFNKLGEKLASAKTIGEEWLGGNYSSAKIKLQEAMRQATLEDINKELSRLEKATEEALRDNKDPPHRTALETKLKKLLPGCTPGVALLRVAGDKDNHRFITERTEIDAELSKYLETTFTNKFSR